ncbi:MAG: phage major capsid protein [Phycisphaerales bacterium]
MPPVASRSFDYGQVETIVQDYYLPMIRNQIFFENALYYRLRKRAKMYSGGRAIVQGLSFSVEGGGGQWWAGLDRMDIRPRNTISAAVFYRKNYSVALTVMRDEEDSVRGPEKIASLVESKMNILRPTAVDAIGTALFNDGTDPKVIGGLDLVCEDTPDTSHTYGGITVSSTVNSWWRNQADTTAYITGANSTFAGPRGFGPIGRMWSKIRRASGKSPTIIVSNTGAQEDYHAALAGPGGAGTATMSGGQRYMQQDADLARAGFDNVMYKTAPWVVDERAPHSASNIEKVYFLHEPAINLCIHDARNMSFDGWYTPNDQRARTGYIDFSGELVCSERRCQGVLTNVDATLTS